MQLFTDRNEWAASFTALAILTGGILLIHHWLDIYDWNQALMKLACFSLFGVGTALLFRAAETRKVSRASDVCALAIALLLILWSAWSYTSLAVGWFAKPPSSDMAHATLNSVNDFFLEGKNPYRGDRKNPFLPGFPWLYGPTLLFGYSPVLLFGREQGIQIVNLCYLALTSIVIIRLCCNAESQSKLSGFASAGLAVGLLVSPYRIWSELLERGATDMLEPLLFVLFLLCLSRSRYYTAGIFVGLALGSKIAYGLFPFIAMLGRDTPRSFYAGFLTGLMPLAVFFAWDAPAIWYHFFWINAVVKIYDSTSLYSILAESAHWIFPVVQLCAVGVAVLYCFPRKKTVRRVCTVSFLLLTVFEATAKEVHGNHLIWFIPIIALNAALFRAAVSWKRDERRVPEG